MRISVQRESCQGHARCAALCPELFGLDDLGFALEKHRQTVPVELEAKARRAAAGCPELAITTEP